MPDSLKDVLMQRLFPSTVPSRTGQAWAPPVPLKPPLQSESPKPALWRGLLEDVMEAQRRIGEAGESLLPGPFSTTPYDPEAALHALLGTSKPKLPGVKGDPEGYMAKTLQKATAVGDDPRGPDKLTLGMAPPVLPGEGIVAPLVSEEGIIAYHGSPYDFSKFNVGKVKSGEGFNMYARGLYFAERERNAENYKNAISLLRNNVKWLDKKTGEPLPIHPREQEFFDQFMSAYGHDLRHGDLEKQADNLKQYGIDYFQKHIPEVKALLDKSTDPEDIEWYAKELDNLRQTGKHYIQASKLFRQAKIEPQGHMYQVRINTTPESLLDWDKALGAQSPRVQDAITKEFGPEWFQQHRELSGKPLYKALDASTTGDAEGVIANARLLKQGIPGAQYLDAGSRRGGYGTRNFVVWDDSYIDILKKFGVALPVIEALRKKASAQGGMLAQDDLTQYQ